MIEIFKVYSSFYNVSGLALAIRSSLIDFEIFILKEFLIILDFE